MLSRFFLSALFSFIIGLPCILTSSPSLAEISKSQATAKAKASHDGKVLSVTKVSTKNGKSTYKVKLLLKNGKVKFVTISG